MYISGTELEKILMTLLQKDLKFCINNKVVKRGKLLLFKQNNYSLDLILSPYEKKKKTTTYNVPIPYDYKLNMNVVIFDYRLITIVDGDKFLLNKIKNIKPVSKNKFYDTILYIKEENEI